MNFSAVLQQFGSVADLLVYFGTLGGAQWLFGKTLARVLENWVAWHNFPAWVKKSTPMVFAVVVATLSQFLISVDVGQYIPEYFAVVILAVVNQLSSQKEYEEIKDSSYGESARIEAENFRG